ncbi:MAG: TIGR04282 family arsenosugar biosynthesis glycosyltransferase [Acidimicrobiales bacterium]
MQLVVIAKEPLPGDVKTRLCPPCTLGQAATIAEAALADTLEAVAATPASRRVVALDGRPGDWLPKGFDVLAQRNGSLANRLFGAFEDCFSVSPDPVVLIGMDTPQVSPDLLLSADIALGGRADAVMGMAPDGGYWLLGLSHLHPGAFSGVPMSADDTGAAQRQRLEECGYTVALVDPLRDFDHADAALEIAALVPGSRFANAVAKGIGRIETA